MSLPPSYTTFSEYINTAIPFLHTYHWLYSIPNNKILVENLLEFIPIDWRLDLQNISTEELNDIPFGYINENWCKSLKDFLLNIKLLKPENQNIPSAEDINLPNEFFKGLNQKKRHEILKLAPFINEICKTEDINVIIDIGAGLGYLPQLLYQLYGYKITGIEADEKKVNAAKKRQIDLYKNSLEHIKYIHHYVNENSVEFLQNILRDYSEQNLKICLIGLHACADLTISLLKLFSKLSCVQKAIVMPCCYHRLQKITRDPCNPRENGEFFLNFPASDSLSCVYKCENASDFLTSAFLRLACQNTAAKWRTMSLEDHLEHSVGAMRRAVLQLVAEKEGYHLSRLKRKSNFPSANNDFLSYLDHLKHTHILTDPTSSSSNQHQLIDSQLFRDRMTDAWLIYENDCYLMEIYTAFQTALQSICENIVLLDRIAMVREWGHVCYARKVTDDNVSPRCYALVASKQY